MSPRCCLHPSSRSASVEILRRIGETTPAAELRLDRDAAWKGDFARQTEKGAALWPRLEPRKVSSKPRRL